MLIKHLALGLSHNRCLANGSFHDDSYYPGCFWSVFFLSSVLFFLYVFNILLLGCLSRVPFS